MADSVAWPSATPVNPFAAVGPDVTIALAPRRRHVNLRINAENAAAVARVLGVELPTAPSTFVEHGGTTVVWLGPDEWLVIDTAATSLLGPLTDAASLAGGAVTDQSGQRVSLFVRGDVMGLLSKGTAVDLHPLAFPVGSAVQSFLGQTIVVFLARSDGIEILARASFSRYLTDWLLDAAIDPLAAPASR
ncbi:MAG: sarcosine oxidase gamma subunit [Glaciihabitans sp.]|nr:sarcosine oxidase gamma subunit [Glaciihabitans sp.]